MKTLAFHKIDNGISWGVGNFSPRRFRNLLASIEAWNGSAKIDTDINFTFDDAYLSFHNNAIDILAEFGHTATVFAPTKYIGKTNTWDYSSRLRKVKHMTFAELSEVVARGISVQSHTHSHRDLTRMTTAEIREELSISKSILEDKLGKAVTEICYPYGRYNRAVEDIAQELGFLRGWSLNPSHVEGFTRGRWCVYSYDTPMSVQMKLGRGAFAKIEAIKQGITNNLSRGERFAFWTD